MLSSDDMGLPSTPQRDDAVFSDAPQRPSSPPSSPPGFPWEQQASSDKLPPPTKPAKSAFSVLGKRKAPLSDISENARPAKKLTKSDGKPLAQMQISLGQKVQQKCKTCGMEYVASSTEDRKLHDKFHKQSTEGYDVGKDFVQKARQGTVFEGATSIDRIYAVDCYDKPARKRRAQAVLEIVQRELGAVLIQENEIWGSGVLVAGKPKFTAYLYIRGTKCLGFVLAEGISKARRVVEPDNARPNPIECVANRGALALLKARKQAAEDAARKAASQPIKFSDITYPATVGISRIWTSPLHRHQGIATTLLDTVVIHHSQYARSVEQAGGTRADPRCDTAHSSATSTSDQLEPVAKENVAFSQPTDAGARLARRWFGKLYGWGVYLD